MVKVGAIMGYINKRKTIGLISNEWFGIETCKVDDIITFIESIPDEPVKEIKLIDSIKTNTKKIEGKFIDIYCK
jgi:hypothetical protein